MSCEDNKLASVAATIANRILSYATAKTNDVKNKLMWSAKLHAESAETNQSYNNYTLIPQSLSYATTRFFRRLRGFFSKHNLSSSENPKATVYM